LCEVTPYREKSHRFIEAQELLLAKRYMNCRKRELIHPVVPTLDLDISDNLPVPVTHQVYAKGISLFYFYIPAVKEISPDRILSGFVISGRGAYERRA
jgi:hypothetical protein